MFRYRLPKLVLKPFTLEEILGNKTDCNYKTRA